MGDRKGGKGREVGEREGGKGEGGIMGGGLRGEEKERGDFKSEFDHNIYAAWKQAEF